MKKIMLGVLVLIPILIMMIVGLVTSFVSTQAYIGVESVSIEEDYVTILFSEVSSDANGRKIIDFDDHMTVTVLPERAANKTLEWRIEGDVEGANTTETMSPSTPTPTASRSSRAIAPSACPPPQRASRTASSSR